jgi:hypothetical protein
MLLVVALIRFPVLYHWFVIPVWLAGCLIAPDSVAWARGRLDPIDPRALVSLVGIHFFFLSPLLHVVLDEWLVGESAVADWRSALGWMAVLNVAGLMAYRFALRISCERLPRHRSGSVWKLSSARFLFVGSVFAAICLAAAVYYQLALGGLAAYFEAIEGNPDALTGRGWLVLIGESFPLVLLLLAVVVAGRRPRPPSSLALLIGAVLFGVLLFVFAGLRGSRANTVWGLLYSLAVVHYWVRPVSRRVLIAGALTVVAFAYFYGFYKGAGRSALSAVEGNAGIAALEELTGRTVKTVILGDLARADVQALILQRVTGPNRSYQYAWGRTYGAALTNVVPSRLWVRKPTTKVLEGTRIQYGVDDPVRFSTRQYGLAGEAMLNFGPLAVLPLFFLWGYLVGTLAHRASAFQRAHDARLLLVPILLIGCVVALVGDSDNVVYICFKYGLFAVPLTLASASIIIGGSPGGQRRTARDFRPGSTSRPTRQPGEYRSARS